MTTHLDFIISWDKAFPGTSYFNKLHFVMSHLPDFVEEYGICGRASGESHESVHAMLARAKESMARMASTQQKYRTLFSRATVNLKEDIAEKKEAAYKSMSGKKRGKYETKTTKKTQDQFDFSSTIFGETLTRDDETYLTICGGGRINSKYKDRFVFVKTGKVPDSWVECFASTQVLSDAKMEVVKVSKH